MPNQMLELMKLAWERCRGDIKSVINYVIGAGVFFCVFIFYALLNLGTNFNYALGQTFPPDSAMLVWAYWGSATYGFVNAASMLLFLAILVCLAEYAGNFLYICYYYDNCSWETPKQIKRFIDEINLHYKKVRKVNHDESLKHKEELISAINKIKSN